MASTIVLNQQDTAKLQQAQEAARSYVSGMPWEALRSKTGLGPEDVIFDIAYIDTILGAFERAEQARNKVKLAWQKGEKEQEQAVSAFLLARDTGKAMAGAFRVALSKTWLAALEDAEIHRSTVLQWDPNVSSAQIVSFADATYALFHSIVQMDKWGYLDQLKEARPDQLLEFTPQANGVVAFWMLQWQLNERVKAQLETDCQAAESEGLQTACSEIRRLVLSPVAARSQDFAVGALIGIAGGFGLHLLTRNRRR